VDPLRIGTRAVGPGQPCFIIAEAGVNHNGDLDLAKRLIDAARMAGAEAVKFQTFAADRLVTPDAPKTEYQKLTTGSAETQLEMLRRLELPAEAHGPLMEYCKRRGLLFLSTPFDEECADMLEALQVGAYKVSSGELTNLPLLAHIARKGKPLIVSTGMASLGEVETAVATVRDAGNPALALLHCVSNYPAAPQDVNLRAMRTLELAFGRPVGYSDHTMGIEVSIAAVALGACIIEKHFTVDRSLPGPDHQASLVPDELAALVRGIRNTEAALGDGCKRPAMSEANTAAAARRSLVAARDLPAGIQLTDDLLALRRPGTGLPPSARPYVVGRKLRRAVLKGTQLMWDLFA